MFCEIFLFPMWHVGIIPFKISFFVIAFSLTFRIEKSSFILPFLLILIPLWFGKFFSYYLFNEINFSKTLITTLNYILVITGYLFSRNIKEAINLNWLPLMALLFSLINLSIIIYGPTAPFLISFYGLDTALEKGLFAFRNPGIATNPNASAMMGNLIMIFWVVSKSFRLVTLESKAWDALVFIFIGIAQLSFVSKSGFIGYILIILYYYIRNLSLRKLSYVLGVLILASLVWLNTGGISDNEETKVISNGIDKLMSLDEALVREIEVDDGGDGNRLVKIEKAFANFLCSPLFGVGADRSSGTILNRTAYHNDWSEILVSTGILGLILYVLVVYRIYRLSVVLLVPFVFPGMTNSFIFTLQIACFYFVFIGLIINRKDAKY